MLFSADTHVIEPPDLFTARLPAADRWRAPIWNRLPGDLKMWTADAVPYAGVSPDYVREVPGRPGAHQLIEPEDPEGFLADMEADGVWGALLHPNLGLLPFDLHDPAFAMRCARIYNDHVAEVYASDRLLPQAVIPIHDIDEAVGEIERVAALGFRGLELPLHEPSGAPYFSQRYEPVWAAAARHHLPISMHIGTGSRLGGVASVTGQGFARPTESGAWPDGHPDRHAAIVARRTTMGGFGAYGDQALTTIPSLVGGGVLERHPDLHVVIVETGARWLANLMDTMDDAWYVGPGVNEVNRTIIRPDGSTVTQLQPDEIGLEWPYPLRPSDYVKRQLHVTFMDDWVALRNRGLTGVEPLLWGNDYPHNEGCWPRSVDAVEGQCDRAGLSSEEKDAIFGGTAARLYGVERPAAMAG